MEQKCIHCQITLTNKRWTINYHLDQIVSYECHYSDDNKCQQRQSNLQPWKMREYMTISNAIKIVGSIVYGISKGLMGITA